MKAGALPGSFVERAVAASPIGRAKRLVGKDFEVLVLARADERVAEALLAMGAQGVGGFEDGGLDEQAPEAERVWLVRALAGRTLHDLMREARGPWAAARVLPIALGAARCLAACERAREHPGPFAPDAVRVVEEPGRGARVTLLASAFVARTLGAVDRSAQGSPSFTPSEQADGAPWDDAANRCALGLVLYKLLSGEHAFGGGGLRRALGDAGHGEAAPFDAKVAAALPPGLQALVLKLLAVDPAARPASARAVADELARLSANHDEPRAVTAGASAILSAVDGAAGSITAAPRRAAPRDDKARARLEAAANERPSFTRYAPVAAGLALALGAVALLGPAPAKTSAAIEVAPRSPLTPAETTALDCASCHPRQASEWRRSVMAHAVRSPLFNGLESLIEEQVGRDDACPGGAGILRKSDPARACKDERSGLPITGSGGEHWCVNCHSPLEKLDGPLAAWDGRPGGDAASRRPVKDSLGKRGLEGISCAFCHEVTGPVSAHVGGARPVGDAATSARGYEGNATWTSFVTGAVFAARPEDARGLRGIGNSGYLLSPGELLGTSTRGSADRRDAAGAGRELGAAHARPSEASKSYLASSEFCGSCHDVRLFGTDVLGASRGEHFKRLRNAYSEWAAWAKDQEKLGKRAASCQDCHMSEFPGACEPANDGDARDADPRCPPGTQFVAREPGTYPRAIAATSSSDARAVTTHYFSGVDVPLSPEFPEALVDEATVDAHGVPLSAKRRRDLLLARTFRFAIGDAAATSGRLTIPIEVENVGAGHRVPAGFSQEREIWVHLKVTDASGRVVYEVGDVTRADQDLGDKIFDRVNANPSDVDGRGRPIGLFGADVRDGRDVPQWSPPPGAGATSFRGKGLVNFQNGFFRCVTCIGTVTPDGRCEPRPGQEVHRADRFADGAYDQDTGACTSNLTGERALFETYFPVGALDATRGLAKGPDAILDTRSMPPGVPLRYTYELATNGARGPFHAEAELLFRAFPPFLIKAFAVYEREQARRGLRPSGPLVTESMLSRLEVVHVARASADVR
ncbi:MAG TPA: hypothetical protein VGM56_27635 [Byssovorax sp.]